MSKSRTSGLQIPYICERFQKPNATERYRTPPRRRKRRRRRRRRRKGDFLRKYAFSDMHRGIIFPCVAPGNFHKELCATLFDFVLHYANSCATMGPNQQRECYTMDQEKNCRADSVGAQRRGNDTAGDRDRHRCDQVHGAALRTGPDRKRKAAGAGGHGPGAG